MPGLEEMSPYFFIIKVSRLGQGILSHRCFFPSFFSQQTAWASSGRVPPSDAHAPAKTEPHRRGAGGCLPDVLVQTLYFQPSLDEA